MTNLVDSGQELANILEKASELVRTHNDDFTLPVPAEGQTAGTVYQLLLVEWNSFQTGNAMGKAQPVASAKSFHLPKVDKRNPGRAVANSGSACRWFASMTYPDIQVSTASYNIAPLSGGIAIGAP